MSATEEVQNAPVEQPQQEAPVAEKPVKEKKAKAPREKKPRAPKTASHPPYFEMIKEALLALNEKSGSSPYAIAKSMEEKHKAVLPANFRKILGLQLKNSAARGKLIKIKASYKLSEAGKDDAPMKKPAAKANAEKKKLQSKPTTVPRTTRTLRSRASKKTEANKIAPAKPAKKPAQTKKRSAPSKPKQPKSIKSPAAKKAKKAAAAAAAAV